LAASMRAPLDLPATHTLCVDLTANWKVAAIAADTPREAAIRSTPLSIGSVAEATGLPAKTIRYYESIGLVGPARRTGGNYRLYDERDVTTLRFVERARRLGFSLKEVAELLTLWRDRRRASADVRRLAEAQIRRVDARLSELQEMRLSLQHLMERCHGDERPDCPILEELAGQREG
jgi:Cu(I)-responsive transcriptional regulator